MPENTIKNASQYSISRLELISATGKSVELNNMFMEINLYEGLFSNTLTGDILIHDSLNLTKYLPIIGQEKLIFYVNTPGFSTKKMIFDVFKISDKQAVKDESATYILHFCSPEFIRNAKRRISKSYTGHYHEIVEQILNDPEIGLGPLKKKRLFRLVDGPNFIEFGPDKTKFLQKMVIPYWNPLTAINWMASRSISADSNDSNFVFYETTEGFHFESIGKLVQMAEIETLKYEPKNVISDKIELNNIDAYKLEHTFDTLRNISSGLYASRLITHDIVRKKIETHDFSGPKHFDKLSHLEQNTRRGLKTHQYMNFSGNNEHNLAANPLAAMRFYPKHQSMHTNVATNNVDQWLQIGQSQMMEIDNYKVLMVLPGNTNYRAGHVVKFDMPEIEALDDNGKSKKKDRSFSGRYLIVSIRHIFKQQKHEMVLEIVKDTVLEPFPELEEPGFNQTLRKDGFV
jgi:hypothetical protein